MSEHRLRLVAGAFFLVSGIPWWLFQLRIVRNEDAIPWLFGVYVLTLTAGLISVFILGCLWIFRVTENWFKRGLFLVPWLVRGLFLVALLPPEYICFLYGCWSMASVIF